MPKHVTREVNRKMKLFGDADFETNHIRVNPKKGGLLNTILHEEIHLKHPNMKEKNIVKKASAEESKLTIRKAIGLLSKFLPEKHGISNLKKRGKSNGKI